MTETTVKYDAALRVRSDPALARVLAELREELATLHQLRGETDEARDELFQCEERFKATLEYAELEAKRGIMSELAAKRTARTDRIRELAELAYEYTGDKKMLGGAVGIRVRKRYGYDAKQALAWCRENAPVCLRLAAAMFEKVIALMDEVPEFVVLHEDPGATIARDLSKYVTQSEQDGD